ncbi:MAG TPA: acetyltransferase, partial [Bryobacteraceae bacterium]|nr:acetyltransferase [Bryobacteraceae bacterium]
MKISLLALLLCASGFAQTPLGQSGAPVLINNSDLAVLGTPEVRKDLPCTVSPNKPVLGFDLRFHAGFDVSIPMDELAGREDQLTILFRVTPQNDKDNPKYFIEHVHVPKIDEGAKGDATLSGGVLLGEGQYHVDWLMRDRSEQVCSFYWDSDAELASKDKPVELAIAPGAVESADLEEFTEEPPVARSQASQPLYIKILVNFAPQNSSSAELRPADTVALVTILRRIARQPQFGKFSLVAYNIQDQRVLYRQSRADKIDFPALGAALKQ